jgi:hypothetical protein
MGGQSTASTADTVAIKIEEMPPQGPEKRAKPKSAQDLARWMYFIYFDFPRILFW